jgi:hypothetical protein
MTFESELRTATEGLPSTIRVWLSRAVRSGWHQIGPGAYEDGSSNRVCPIVAAAKMASVWGERGLRAGHSTWGTPDGPSPAVEEFAASFDLCAEEIGTGAALEVVIESLEPQATQRASASSSR